MDSKLIGKGITFPIKINATGNVDIVGGKELLEASIKTILYWPKHQRFFNRTFGCRIFEMIEEPNDNIAKALVRTFLFEAINTWEKRVVVKSVKILESSYDAVNIEMIYIVRSTMSEETMIFPFYKEIIY